MTYAEAIEFYNRYVGLLSDDEIHEETGMSISKLRRKKRMHKGQLCWSCAKACNDFLCEWPRMCNGTQEEMMNYEYPDFITKTDIITKKKWHRGRLLRTEEVVLITECKNYEWDGKSK